MLAMQYLRPSIRRPISSMYAPIPGTRAEALAGLGDELSAAAAVPGLVAKIKALIIAKAGPLRISANQDLRAAIHTAADIVTKGNAGTLDAASQNYWNAWRKQAEPIQSTDNVAWIFGRVITRWRDGLIQAVNDQSASGVLSDPKASKAAYTLMDTTQQGTTWYGGTATTSKLDNGQWGSVFESGFNVIARGVISGTLPFTYLDVLVSAMGTEPVKRRFPVWQPPFSGLTKDDPRAAAFRATLKQLGWNSVLQLWFSYTQQAWVQQNAADEAQDASLSSMITSLSYVSGKVILDQVVAKVQDYFKAREEARAAFAAFAQLQTGPLGDQVPAADAAAIAQLRQQFGTIDGKVSDILQPAGLWPSGTPAGLSFLGIAQLIVGGVAAIGILGMLVWGISFMTQTTRLAAAQTKATSESILATVGEVKASCIRAYQASGKTPADEKAYQDCLLKTQALTDSIPKPPTGSDPLGLKWVAILGLVGVGGFMAYKQFGKK